MSDRQTDFIEQLFNAFSSDPTMPAELKISLLRLQLPIHKLSQSDNHFITNEKHPARRTLFTLKRLSHFAKSDPTLIEKVDLILSDLMKSSPTAINFGHANQRLELLAQNLESNTPETVTTNNDQNTKLKQYLNSKIKLCIQGNKIPNSCQDLILRLWPNALFYLLKTHGEKSPHWINAIKIYCDLLDAIQPIVNIEQHRQLKDRYMSIARSNNNMLLLYHQESKVEPAIKALITQFNKMLGKNTPVSQSNNATTPSISDRISSLPSDIKPGVWCEIYIDDVTPSRRLRLSVINIKTGMLIFVNRKGIKKLEKDALEFSNELKRGLSKIYKHDALFSKPKSSTRYQKIG